MTISAVVHTYNEERNLPDCLASLAFCDEIVVVDNESTDRTVELARAAGARVAVFSGRHGYPEPARVFGLAQLTQDWVLIVDADERVTPELRDELRRLDSDPGACDGYWVPIRNYHFGRWLRHGGLYPDLHLRFFRRGKGGYPEVGLHRGVAVDGPQGNLTGDLLHFSYRNLAHYFGKFNAYTDAEAERIVAQGRRPGGYDLLLKPWHRWLKAYVFKAGFRDGLAGFLFHAFSAAYVFASELKAWETFSARGEKLPVLATLFSRGRGRRQGEVSQ
ncbi:MAG: glycosyltransferase family 2 protein [candidate division FCPU426 bacterium]